MSVSLNATHMSVFAMIATATMVCAPHPTAAQTQGHHVVILPDASGSFAGATDALYARRVAGDVDARLPAFQMRDVVTIMPFGEYSTRNMAIEAVISRRFAPQVARRSIAAMISDFPDMVGGTGGGTQQATHILATLDQMARRLNCADKAGHVFVLSDGQETGQSMTLPTAPIFEGCASFTMIGLRGRTPDETRQLSGFWMRWCEAAGFQRCDWLS
ncbi:MAG: hypothetical protein ACE37E_11200 [Hyphomicrobiales bacterium]